MKINSAIIRQFKALPLVDLDGATNEKYYKYLRETFRKGFVLSQEIINEYSNLQLAEIIKSIEKEYGLTSEKLNASFHKSWKKIVEADIEQLVIEQIVHYITTYGYEALGIYDENTVYFPKEKLDIPELEDIKLVVIKGYTKDELKEKLIKMLGSGIALKEQTKKDLVEIAKFVGMSTEEVENVKNKEVRTELFSILGLVPSNPTEFLRYLIYFHTKNSLLIKNKDLIDQIKESEIETTNLIEEYSEKYGLERLAEIFYRYKSLWLAFKKYSGYRSYINKIRRLAKTHHKPMPEDYLNSITSRIKRTEGKDRESVVNYKLNNELNKVNIFRKIRLAYALKFRTTDADSIMFRVRNGKSFSKEFSFEDKVEAQRVLDIVLDSIVEDIRPNVEGKKIYIPKNVIYTLPATEKQFTGNLPTGSYVNVDSDMIVGINWHNLKRHIVDLDLSMQNVGGKIGWDGDYRTNDREMLFSGDITDAKGKNGATELFYIKKQVRQPYIMNVNYYNYEDNKPVPFKIMVAKEKTTKFNENYMVDPNNVICIAKSVIDKKQSVLGLVVPSETGNRFYFTETGIGNSRSSGDKEYMNQARKFLLNNYENSIKLRDILEKAGAIFVESMEELEEGINLEYSTLEKDTILNLFIKTKEVPKVEEEMTIKGFTEAIDKSSLRGYKFEDKMLDEENYKELSDNQINKLLISISSNKSELPKK